METIRFLRSFDWYHDNSTNKPIFDMQLTFSYCLTIIWSSRILELGSAWSSGVITTNSVSDSFVSGPHSPFSLSESKSARSSLKGNHMYRLYENFIRGSGHLQKSRRKILFKDVSRCFFLTLTKVCPQLLPKDKLDIHTDSSSQP